MKRLIQTNFTYQAEFDGFKRNTGSYLGRKIATEKTIRRFLAINAKRCHLPAGVKSVTVTSSFESRWLYRV